MTVRFKPGTPMYDLTVGNLYRVIGIEADDLRLMNDLGRPHLYAADLFDVVDPQWPDDWVVSHGTEGETYAYADGLNAPGFFERVFDDDASATATLQAYLVRSRQQQQSA